jgi:hypothetical protein
MLTSTGGLSPSPPAGSTCTITNATYNYDAASHVESWHVCEAGSNTTQPWTFATGSVTLSTNDAATLEAALGQVHPGSPCAGDFQDTLVIVSDSGSSTFSMCATGERDVFDLLTSHAP